MRHEMQVDSPTTSLDHRLPDKQATVCASEGMCVQTGG